MEEGGYNKRIRVNYICCVVGLVQAKTNGFYIDRQKLDLKNVFF